MNKLTSFLVDALRSLEEAGNDADGKGPYCPCCREHVRNYGTPHEWHTPGCKVKIALAAIDDVQRAAEMLKDVPVEPVHGLEGVGLMDLLEDVSVDGPEERAEHVRFNEGGPKVWPEGWWAVSDGTCGYVAFFQHEADAYAYRLFLVNVRQNARRMAERYG